MSKGSSRRKPTISDTKFSDNWSNIFNKGASDEKRERAGKICDGRHGPSEQGKRATQ